VVTWEISYNRERSVWVLYRHGDWKRAWEETQHIGRVRQWQMSYRARLSPYAEQAFDEARAYPIPKHGAGEWHGGRVRALFQSHDDEDPRSPLVDYNLIAADFVHGYLQMETLPLPLTPPTEATIADFRKAFAGGGDEHGWLKWWAGCWLRSQGDKAVYFEAEYMHLRADVVSDDSVCIVECGNTEPLKLMYSLMIGAYSFVLVPFWAHPNAPEGVLHRFTLTDAGAAEYYNRVQLGTEKWLAAARHAPYENRWPRR
jgi:hypothetical protein